jgi:hypothetical protein
VYKPKAETSGQFECRACSAGQQVCNSVRYPFFISESRFDYLYLPKAIKYYRKFAICLCEAQFSLVNYIGYLSATASYIKLIFESSLMIPLFELTVMLTYSLQFNQNRQRRKDKGRYFKTNSCN